MERQKASEVKSAETSTPMSNSRAEVEQRIHHRYGANGLSVSQDYKGAIA